jgi:hypothetical protein
VPVVSRRTFLIDCGTGDPFYRDVQDYASAFLGRGVGSRT